jgi:hypothetical protein
MSKLEQTGPRSVSTTPDEVRRRHVSTSLMLPSQQSRSTTKDNSLSLVDGDSRIIRLRAHGVAFRQNPSLRRSDGMGGSNVIHFHSRGNASRLESKLRSWNTAGKSPIENIDRHESASESDDNYRHRMLENILAAVVLLVLMISGYWVVNALAAVK